MNKLQVLSYQNNKIRTINKNGELWWVLKDVCDVLEIKNITQAAGRLDIDERSMFDIGRQGRVNIVNEPGLYNVILRSDKPESKAFKRWVTHEVLPSIRKTGAYATDPTKQSLAEAKLRNARSREASMWLKIAQSVPIEDYKLICASHASAVLSGGIPAIPLPAKTEKMYSATDIQAETGISAITIGKVATAHGLKTPEYGKEVWDKAKNSNKQIPSWRYNEHGRKILMELLKGAVA